MKRFVFVNSFGLDRGQSVEQHWHHLKLANQ